MPSVSEIAAALQESQFRRKWMIKSVNRQANAVGALVRLTLGWSPEMPEKEREKIAARAASIIGKSMTGNAMEGDDARVAKSVGPDLDAVKAAIIPMQKRRDEIELRMKKLVRELPVHAWAKGVRGFGEIGLAVTVGECGDLATYSGPRKMRKRLGLAPMDGNAMSTWKKGGLTAEDWVAAGYSPKRRAEIYSCVGESLSKAQLESMEKSGTPYGRPLGPYGAVYVARREATAIAHPDWTKAHARADALRVMTQQLMLDLWLQWNGRERDIPLGETLAERTLIAAVVVSASLPIQFAGEVSQKRSDSHATGVRLAGET